MSLKNKNVALFFSDEGFHRKNYFLLTIIKSLIKFSIGFYAIILNCFILLLLLFYIKFDIKMLLKRDLCVPDGVGILISSENSLNEHCKIEIQWLKCIQKIQFCMDE